MSSHQRVVDGGRIKGGGDGAKRFQHGVSMFDDRGSGVNSCLDELIQGASTIRQRVVGKENRT